MKECKSCGAKFDVAGDFELTCQSCVNINRFMFEVASMHSPYSSGAPVNFYKKYKVELRGVEK